MKRRMKLIHGDCLVELKKLEDNSVDSIVTDPPYGLSFMGKKWDYDVPSEEVWRECLRVLKPGGHLLAFAGTRTQHRMAVRIEDAGFEIRDMIAWVYGSGFPKSLNIGKAVDKLQGNEREVLSKEVTPFKVNGYATDKSNDGYKRPSDGSWETDENGYRINTVTKGTSPHEGWGTALKPALEPITVARKPLIGTVAENVLEYGTGGINIDGCRVPSDGSHMVKGIVTKQTTVTGDEREGKALGMYGAGASFTPTNHEGGRFPANLIHDGSEEVVGLFPETTVCGGAKKTTHNTGMFNIGQPGVVYNKADGNNRSAARFFYCAKASKKDRDEGLEGFTAKNNMRVNAPRLNEEEKHAGLSKNFHPTVKPTDLMRYLCRLVTPPGGIVLDPFMGSGSTGKAAKLEGFKFIGIEREAEYVEIARARITGVQPTLM